MAKKNPNENEHEHSLWNNNLLPGQSNELKFLVTDGTVALHSGYGLVDIRNGSLKISPSYSSPEFEIGIRNRVLALSPTEDLFSIKDGVLCASSSLTIEQSNIFKTQVDNSLLTTSKGAFYTSPAREAVFDIRSQPLSLGIGENTLTIRDAAFTVSPERNSLVDDNPLMKSLTIGNVFSIKDGIFALSAEPRSFLVEGATSVIKPVNENILTIRDGTLIPNPNMTLLTGENPFLKFDALQGTLAIKDEPFKLTTEYTSAYQVATQTQNILSGIDWLHAGSGLGIDILDQSRMQESFLGLSNSYSDLFLKSEAVQPAIVSLPKSVAAISSIEYFHNANLLSLATYIKPNLGYLPVEEHIVEEIHGNAHEELFAQLEKMNAGLKSMFQGAVYAFNSSNPDRVRHFSTSLRELFTHVLHELSPDDEIHRWSKSKDDFDNGKPTKRARLLYICREINQDRFEKFLNADVKALLEFLNLFQSGTHSIQPGYTNKQMKAMLMRMESTLRFLIEVSRV